LLSFAPVVLDDLMILQAFLVTTSVPAPFVATVVTERRVLRRCEEAAS
jgi:hypothetical protein